MNAPATYQPPPLHVAVAAGDVATAKSLLDGGAGVDSLDEKYGFTPLHLACFYGQHAALCVLLKKGGNTEIRDHNGDTPLQVACRLGHFNCALELLRVGAKIDVRNREGASPIYLAAVGGGDQAELTGHLQIVRALLKRGADASIKDCMGRLAIDVATDEAVKSLLRRAQATRKTVAKARAMPEKGRLAGGGKCCGAFMKYAKTEKEEKADE